MAMEGEVSRERLAALAEAIDAWLDTSADRTFQFGWNTAGFYINGERCE